MSRFGLSRAPTARAQAPHAAPHGAPAAGAGRGSVAGSVGEAVGEAAAGAAAGAASRGSGRSGLGMLSQFLASNAPNTVFKILLAYAAFKGVMGFKDDVLNGTPYATGGAVPPDRLAAAAAGSNRNGGTASVQHAASPVASSATPAVIDPRVERNMATVAGRDALAASVRFDGALDGKSEADRLVYADGRYPIPGPERPVLEANSGALGQNDNASFVRMTVPGGHGKTVDFLANHAVNDRAALQEFQEAYPRLAREHGLPAELPPGASVMIGRAPGMGEVFQTSQPREYRFIQDTQFQRNARFDGSMDDPGARSFAAATGYRDGSRPFDLAEIRQGDTNVVRASRVDEQSRESSLIQHEEAYVGSMNDTVKSPVSVMDRMLGRSTGSGFEDLAKAISPSPRETRLLQSVDLGSQQRSVGLVGKEGSAVIGTGPSGDFISLAHRGREGVAMNIQVSAAKGALGSFEAGGGFSGTEAATAAMGNVRQAMANRLDSPVLSAVKRAGVAGEKDVMLDLTPGKESAVTRIHYGDRIVDYAARDGQMTMIERDPRTNTVREAAMIRSRDIRVDAQGHIAMDPASQQVLNDHVKVYASGRPGQEFAQMHPLETTQFVSLRDASSPAPGTAVAAAGRPGVPDVEATGTASAVREASLRETATPVSVAETSVQPARRVASAGLGE